MSWCDKLLSVPTVGIRLSPRVISGDALITALAPVLNKNIDEKKRDFEIARSDVVFQVNFSDGFSYVIDDHRVAVAFAHRMGIQATSGGLPKLQHFSTVLPFTEVAMQCAERLSEIVGLLPDASERRLTRTGVLSTTTVAIPDAPPGVQRLVEYFQAPWGRVDAMTFQVLGQTSDGEKWRETCLHQLVKPEDESIVPQLVLDWQRTFKEPQEVGRLEVGHMLRQSVESAIDYFDFVGEQGFHDVQPPQ